MILQFQKQIYINKKGELEMEMKKFITRDKNYLIGENGVVFEQDGKETKDIYENNNHYFLKGYPVHRIVYQLFKGDIPTGFVCHHINTVPKDNRPSNLILIATEEHGKLHGDINRHPQFKQHLIDSSQPYIYQYISTPTKRKKKKVATKVSNLQYGCSNGSFSIAKFEKRWPQRRRELRLDELSDRQLKKLLKKRVV